MHARAGNGLRPYPGLQKGMSPRSNENRYMTPNFSELRTVAHSEL